MTRDLKNQTMVKKKKKKSAMDEMGMGNIVMYYKVRKEVWVKPTQHNTQ